VAVQTIDPTGPIIAVDSRRAVRSKGHLDRRKGYFHVMPHVVKLMARDRVRSATKGNNKMTLKECWDKACRDGLDDVRRFMRDMKRSGLKRKMRYYKGRSFWTGPAIVTDDLQAVLSATKVKCQWDNMGLEWVVYPCQSIEIAPQLLRD